MMSAVLSIVFICTIFFGDILSSLYWGIKYPLPQQEGDILRSGISSL